MKLNLILISLAGLFFTRPRGFCTANADAPTLPPEFQKQLDDQAEQIAVLQKQLGAAQSAPTENLGTLALLAKGAGVELEDVRWRFQAGVAPEQAVQAAISQKQENADRKKRDAEAAKAAKAAK